MANIYTRRQKTDAAKRFYSAEGNSGELLYNQGNALTQQADATKQYAQRLYGSELDLETETQFNELINNPAYSANPEGLKTQLQGVIKGIADNIADDDLRSSFLTGAQKSSMRYVNQALNNRTSEIKEAEREAKADARAAAAEQRQIAREQRSEQRQIAREERTAARQEAKTARARAVSTYTNQLKLEMQGLYEQSPEDSAGLRSMFNKSIADTLGNIPDEDMQFDVLNKVIPSYLELTGKSFANARSSAKTEENREYAAKQKAEQREYAAQQKAEQREYSENLYKTRQAENRAYTENKEAVKQAAAEQKESAADYQDAQIADFEYQLEALRADPQITANPNAYQTQAYTMMGKYAARFDDPKEEQKFITAATKRITTGLSAVNKNAVTAEKQLKTANDKLIANTLSNQTSDMMSALLQNEQTKASPAALRQEADRWYQEQMKKNTEQGVSDVLQAGFAADYAKQLNSAVRQANDNARKQFDANRLQVAEESYRAGADRLATIAQQLQVYPDMRTPDTAADIVEAKQKMNDYIFAKDSDGEFVFSNKERTAMLRDTEKSLVSTAKQYFLNLPVSKKETYAKELLSGISTPSGNTVQIFSADARQELMDYANNWLNKYKAEQAKKSKDYETPEDLAESIEKANRYTQAEDYLNEEGDKLYKLDKKGKRTKELDGDTNVMDMIEYSSRIKDAWAQDSITPETYQKMLGQIQYDKLSLAKEFRNDPLKGRNPYLGTAYKALEAQIDPDKTMSTAEAYTLMEMLYQGLRAAGLDPKGRAIWLNDEEEAGIKKAVEKTKQAYLQAKNDKLWFVNARQVVGGVDVVDWRNNTPVTDMTNLNRKPRELRRKADGSIWQVVRDPDGNITDAVRIDNGGLRK